MKLLFGFVVLLVALVAISGCTQQAQPTTTVTPTEITTAPTTVQETAVATMVTTVVSEPVTTLETTVVTPNQTTEVPVVTPTPITKTGVTTIHITSAGFNPQIDTVLPGTGISWVNDDTVSHSIKTIGNHTGMFNSGEIIPKAQFAYTFSENVGTYTYALSDNSTITGTIIVKAGVH
ncbi:MAG: hypothetical protein ABFC71_03335 [Methanoregula sp.]